MTKKVESCALDPDQGPSLSRVVSSPIMPSARSSCRHTLSQNGDAMDVTWAKLRTLLRECRDEWWLRVDGLKLKTARESRRVERPGVTAGVAQ